MPDPGRLLASRYRLDARIGGGGMGEVWRATDQVLHRTVAVKLMRPALMAERSFAERFLAEARTMATIRHRGVVSLHDYRGGGGDGDAFLVMEYVAGESLSQRLQRLGRLDPVLTMALVAQAAEALQAAHDKGVVHRDIKPGNLLVTDDDTLVLTDFGIARSLDAAAPLTATGAVLGTPAYLSPEQVRGQPASPRSDVYSLGVVAYECLAGRRPFGGDNPFEIAVKRLREAPTPLSRDLPAPVVTLVERAMATEPADRWPSAAALARAARRAVDPTATAIATAPVHPPYPPGRLAPPASAPAASSAPVPAAAPSPAMPAAGRSAARPKARPTPRPPASRPRWATRQRPVPIVAANVLLCLTALCLLVYSVSSALLLDELLTAVRAVYGAEFDQWHNASRTVGMAALGLLALLGLLFLLLAGFNGRGSRLARAWTFTLGVATLCCGGSCWWLGTLNIEGYEMITEAMTNLDRELAAQMPEWYGPMSDLTTTGALGALLLALGLLMLPSANRFFRSPPPRPPYHYPYPYPHHQPPRS